MVQLKASTLENQMVGGGVEESGGWETFLPSTDFRRQSVLWALEFGSEELFCHFNICLSKLFHNKISSLKIKVLSFFKFAQYRLEGSIIFSIPG